MNAIDDYKGESKCFLRHVSVLFWWLLTVPAFKVGKHVLSALKIDVQSFVAGITTYDCLWRLRILRKCTGLGGDIMSPLKVQPRFAVFIPISKYFRGNHRAKNAVYIKTLLALSSPYLVNILHYVSGDFEVVKRVGESWLRDAGTFSRSFGSSRR